MEAWISIVFSVLIAIALIIGNIYLLAYYCHPDDKGTVMGIVTKVIVVIGLTLSWAMVLMVPMDVTNSRGLYGGSINMQVFWYIIYIISAAFILIIFPITTAFYEADSDWSCCEKIKYSFCCFIVVAICFIGITLILYFTIGDTRIPVDVIYCPVTLKNIQDSGANFIMGIEPMNNCLFDNKAIFKMKVNFIIYIIGLMSFVSWIVFAIFGGIGLAAIPLDLFLDFCTRPKRIKIGELSIRKQDLLQNALELQALGKEVKMLEEKGYDHKCCKYINYVINYIIVCSREYKEYQRKLHEFRAGVLLAQQEYEICNISEEMRKKQSCIQCCYYFLIPLGIICTILTILWIAQFICVYFVIIHGRAGYPFLSYLFLFFEDNQCGFISYFFFAFFCLYLLWATMKGNIKFGVRIFCCWTIHPMKKDGTYMNSFLFNVSLILLASVSITQFCVNSFTDYVALTDIDMMFNVLINYLIFFEYFYRYHVFEYLFFAVFVVSLIYLLIRPKDQITAESLYKKRKHDDMVELKSNPKDDNSKESK